MDPLEFNFFRVCLIRFDKHRRMMATDMTEDRHVTVSEGELDVDIE